MKTIKERATNYAVSEIVKIMDSCSGVDSNDILKAYEVGATEQKVIDDNAAKCAKQLMIDQACEYLSAYMTYFEEDSSNTDVEKFVNGFRKTMENLK